MSAETAIPLTPLWDPRIGIESRAAPGTFVPAIWRMKSMPKLMFDPQTITKLKSTSPSLRHSDSIPEEEFTNFTADFDLDYRDFGRILAGAYGTDSSVYGVVVGDGTNGFEVGVYAHTWVPQSGVAPQLQPMSVEGGFTFPDSADNIIIRFAGVVWNSIKINTTRSQNNNNVTCQLAGYGGLRSATAVANTFSTQENTVYTLDRTLWTAGTLTWITPDGKTAVITFNDLAATIQTALRAATCYNGAVVTVTGTTVLTITLISTLAGILNGLPVLDTTTDLTFAGSVTFNFKKDTDNHFIRGGPRMYDHVEVKANEVSSFYGTRASLYVVGGAFNSSAKQLHNHSTNLDASGLHQPHWFQNSGKTSYAISVPQGVAAGRTETVEATGLFLQGLGYWDDWRAQADKMFGFHALSAETIPGTTSKFYFRVDGRVIVQKIGQMTDVGGSCNIPGTFSYADDLNNGNRAIRYTLVNDVPTYAVA